MGYLLGPVTVMCSLLPFFREKNVSFAKKFGICPTAFLYHGALSSTIAPGLASGEVVNVAPI